VGVEILECEINKLKEQEPFWVLHIWINDRIHNNQNFSKNTG